MSAVEVDRRVDGDAASLSDKVGLVMVDVIFSNGGCQGGGLTAPLQHYGARIA